MTRYGIDPVDEAIYDTAHGYVDPDTGEKGVNALARKTGRNGTTLYKKVDPFVETHLINIVELRSIMRETGNFSIIKTLAMDCGYGTFLLSDGSSTDNRGGILNCVLKVSVESAEARKAVSKTLKDGKVTAKESAECSAEINDEINSLIELRQEIINSVIDPKNLSEGDVAWNKRVTKCQKL